MARKIPAWVWLGLAAAGGYALLKKKAAAATATGAGAGAFTNPAPALLPGGGAPDVGLPVELPGSSAPVMSQLASAQSLWLSLTPTSPPSSGYINFPSGTQVPAAELGAGNTAMDAGGNVFVLWGGQVYALGFPDPSGNWPATLVTGN